MKKLTALMLVTMLWAFSICAEQSNNEIHSNLSKLGKSVFSGTDISDKDIDALMKDHLGTSLRVKGDSITTYDVIFQYNDDGCLQQLAFYGDFCVGTNFEGPRRGAQIIISDEGAIIDMCNNHKKHKSYFSHKYTWADIRTHNDHQTIVFKQ